MANTKKYVSLDKLGLYDGKIKKVISDGDKATLDAAKAHAEGLASNYDAAGAAASVDEKLTAEVNRAKAAEEANAAAAKKAQDEVDALELVVDEIQRNAYNDTELRNLISGLDTNKADKTQVATDIAAAVKVEEDARKLAVQGVQDAVNTLSGTHATDKKNLEDAIALKADQTALDAVSGVANAAVKQSDYNAKVEALEAEDERIAGLVTAEAERAADVEADFEERIAKMEVFWDTTEDADGVVNKLKEIQDYIAGDETGAAEMAGNIQANTQAIAAHVATDHDFGAADEALKAELEAEIDKKADSTVVEGIDGRLETAEGKITAVEGRMDTAEGKIAGLEAKFAEGEGSVADMIADAVAAEAALREAGDTATAEAAAKDAADKDVVVLSEAQKYTDGEIDKVEAAVATLEGVVNGKAAQADLNALAGRVTTAEGEIDTLQTEMDAVEALAAANKAAHEANAAAIALKADATALTAVSDRVTAIETWHSNFVEVSEQEINDLFA